MQLTREARCAHTRCGLSAFTRTVLALCVIVAPARGGVLPEDRADVLWHSYHGGDISIQGLSVLVRKKVGDNLSLSANYYEDMISSASIDVKLSASPYHEKREQWSGGADYLHGKSTYSAGFITSKEPDYKANTSYFALSQDMFGDLTTFTLGYRRGWDRVFKDGKNTVTGQIEHVPFNNGLSQAIADHRGHSLSPTPLLTPNPL